MSLLSQLRQLLTNQFSESDLRTLTFDLGLDFELLPGPTKGDKARELITQLGREGRLPEMIKLGREQWSYLAWPDVPADPVHPPTPTRSSGQTPFAEPPRSSVAVATNPFTYGNPISDPNRFFGRRREIEQIFERLGNAESESSSIVGGRRIGKSSLLNQLAHPDVYGRYGFKPERALFVYLDLQMVDQQTTPVRLWQHLLSQIERLCPNQELGDKLRTITNAPTIDNFALADLFDEIDRNGFHVILLLDEFDNVTTNPNFDTGFFYGLRSLAIQHNLSLVTSSQQELIELTHSQAIRSSPFFNIFANINVRLFSESEALHLVSTLLSTSNIQFSDEERATLIEISGGHPMLLQAAGYFLFDAYTTFAAAEPRREAWLKRFRTEAGPHLAHSWRGAEPHEKITLLLLTLWAIQGDRRTAIDPAQLDQFYPRSGQTLARLVRQGYAVEAPGGYGLFSTTWRDWITAEIRSRNVTGGEAPHQESGRDALATMPTARQEALEPLLESTNSRCWPLLIAWLTETKDPDASLALLQAGLRQ